MENVGDRDIFLSGRLGVARVSSVDTRCIPLLSLQAGAHASRAQKGNQRVARAVALHCWPLAGNRDLWELVSLSSVIGCGPTVWI